MRLTLMALTVLFMVTGSTVAGETYTVTPRDIPLTLEKECVLSPAEAIQLIATTRTWKVLKIARILPHGERVKKGQTLLAFETRQLDEAIRKAETKRDSTKLNLTKAKDTLEQLKKARKIRLDIAKHAVKAAEQDLSYFKTSLEPLKRKKATKAVVDVEKLLKYSQAEYDQLKKMYSEDQVTEETEEIILERQKDRLRHRTFQLQETKIITEKTLTLDIPRELQTLQNAVELAKLNYNKLKIDLTSELSLAAFEHEALTSSLTAQEASLSDLKSDREALVIKAPVDGRLYHGIFNTGKWDTKVMSSLKTGLSLLPGTRWGTLVTSEALQITVALPESDSSAVTPGVKGLAEPNGMPGAMIPATVTECSRVPNTAGQFLVSLSLNQTEPPHRLLPGQLCNLTMTIKTLKQALVIPSTFVYRDEADNLAPYVWLQKDSGHIKRPVKAGHVTSKGIQIVHGLNPGDTLIKTKKTTDNPPEEPK